MNPTFDPKSISLPVVGSADYRHAVPGEMWELSPASLSGPISYRSEPRDNSPASVSKLAAGSLATPIDFPSIDAAIIEGDHVAIAVDPNVPQVEAVIEGVVETLAACQAGRISIVLWPEATDLLVEKLKQQFQNCEPDGVGQTVPATEIAATQIPATKITGAAVTVSRHAPRTRGELRYVAADADAEAMYLARDIVDADFTLPIVAARAGDAIERLDKTGIFPVFADSSTLRRYQGGELAPAPSESLEGSEESQQDSEEPIDQAASGSLKASNAAVNEVGFLLGVQLMVAVSANAEGAVGSLIAGTPDSIRHELETLHAVRDVETRPTAELVVAALDGDSIVQTWPNIARAAIAAASHVEGDGTIVVWSRVNHRPSDVWQQELSSGPELSSTADYPGETSKDDFDNWATDRVLARQLATLLSDYRVMLYSESNDQFTTADVEKLGIGVIDSVEQLRRLGESFQGAGMIRAAHFHGPSVARLTHHV